MTNPNQMERVSRAAITIGIVLVVFLPLVVAKGVVLPFTIGKVLVFRAVVDLLLVPAAYLLVRTGWRRILTHPVVACWTALLAVRVIAGALGADPFQSFWGELDRSEGLWTEIHVWLFLLVATAAFGSGMRIEPILGASVAAALLSLADALLLEQAKLVLLGQVSMRSSGTVGNPAFLANYLMFHSFFALFLAARASGAVRRTLFALCAGILGVGVLATLTRSTAVPFLAALGVTGAVVGVRLIERLRLGARLASYLSVGALGAGLLLMPAVPARFSRLTTLSLHDTSLVHRFFVWKISLEAAAARPLLGWGPENHLAAYYAHFDPAVRRYGTEVYDRAHNMILDAAVSAGVVGLAATAALHVMIAAALIRSVRRRRGSDRDADIILLGAHGAYLFSNMFLFEQITTWIPLALLAGIAAARTLGAGTAGLERSAVSAEVRLAPAIAGGVGAALLLLTVIHPSYALACGTAARASYARDLPGSIALYEKAFEAGSFANREMGKELSLRLIGEGQEPGGPVDRQSWLLGAALAEETLRGELRRHPWDISFSRVLARLDDVWADVDPSHASAGLAIYEDVHRRYPNLVDNRWELALRRIRAGETDAGVRLLEETAGMVPSYGFQPEFGEGYLYLGIGYALAGRDRDSRIALGVAERMNYLLRGEIRTARERIRAQTKSPPAVGGDVR